MELNKICEPQARVKLPAATITIINDGVYPYDSIYIQIHAVHSLTRRHNFRILLLNI